LRGNLHIIVVHAVERVVVLQRPMLSASIVLTVLVAMCVKVIFAPGMTAPVLSVIVPVILAVSTCP